MHSTTAAGRVGVGTTHRTLRFTETGPPSTTCKILSTATRLTPSSGCQRYWKQAWIPNPQTPVRPTARPPPDQASTGPRPNWPPPCSTARAAARSSQPVYRLLLRDPCGGASDLFGLDDVLQDPTQPAPPGPPPLASPPGGPTPLANPLPRHHPAPWPPSPSHHPHPRRSWTGMPSSPTTAGIRTLQDIGAQFGISRRHPQARQ